MGGMGRADRAVLPGGESGPPPMGIEKMLRMYLLQCWFSLSDAGVEDAMHDGCAFKKFSGMDRDRESERRKASVESKIEWPYLVVKIQFGYCKADGLSSFARSLSDLRGESSAGRPSRRVLKVRKSSGRLNFPQKFSNFLLPNGYKVGANQESFAPGVSLFFAFFRFPTIFIGPFLVSSPNYYTL